MKQATLFEEPADTRVVDACPVCRCCDRVDGVCLGDCATNLHRINRDGSAPSAGGWVDIENALKLPYPEAMTHDETEDD